MKADFPFFQHNDGITYVDNAATTQKPRVVIEALKEYYEKHNANAHRSNYDAAKKATQILEESREVIADHMNADAEHVVFTQNCTDALNRAIHNETYRHSHTTNIVSTTYNHHSLHLPILRLVQQTNAEHRVVSPAENMEEAVLSAVNEDTKTVCLTHVSNVTGRILDVERITERIRQKNPHVRVLVDGCQAVPNLEVDTTSINADYYAWSGHKVYGPTGVGILVTEHLNEEPMLLGGGTVQEVTKETYDFVNGPQRHEAGTQNIAAIHATAVAHMYHDDHRVDTQNQTKALLEALQQADIDIYEEHVDRVPVVSIKTPKDPYDIATLCNEENVCIRSGTHCAEPLLTHYGVHGTARISLSAYNDEEDIKTTVHAIKEALQIL